jgi:hypothetical protein
MRNLPTRRTNEKATNKAVGSPCALLLFVIYIYIYQLLQPDSLEICIVGASCRHVLLVGVIFAFPTTHY